MFCFPYAGGGTLTFRHWSKALPTGVEVYLVQLPGRETLVCEPPLTRLSEIVEAIVPELSPYLDKPFAFFGHSMGAFISFEIASLLRQRYQMQPAHLIVSGCRAPQIPRTKPPIYNLPDERFLEELRRLNGTPEEVLQNPEISGPILRSRRPIPMARQILWTARLLPSAACRIRKRNPKTSKRGASELLRHFRCRCFPVTISSCMHLSLSCCGP